MRSHREHVILAAVLATAMASGRAGAQTAPAEAAPAETGEAAPPTAQPAPKVAAAPKRVAPPARWSEGGQIIPSIGINSFQGDTGQGMGVGLRVGLLGGLRLIENLSLNVGAAFDKVNMSAPDTSRFIVDIGFNPLIHFPREKFEIVAGPVVGAFLDKVGSGSGSFSSDTWAYGWTAGVNAGVFFPVGAKARLGGLVNFYLRNLIKTCTTTNGMDVCFKDGLPTGKMLAVSLAAMF